MIPTASEMQQRIQASLATDNLAPLLTEAVIVCGQLILETPKEKVKELLTFLKNRPDLSFEVLMDLTAVDYLDPIKQTKLVYWLHQPVTYARVRVITYVNREESLPSVADLWPGADWYEREVYDLFGVAFTGHPDLKRILMPDNWQGHPLRRDYALTEESVEFKHGVKPKVPSQIISYGKNKLQA